MKKNTIKLIVAAIVLVALGYGFGAALQHFNKSTQAPVAQKTVDHYSMSTVTEKQTTDVTVFKAWCVSHYSDGSYTRKYLGEFKIFANMPKQFGFIANGCENTDPNN